MTLTELSASLERQLTEVVNAKAAHDRATTTVTATAKRYEEAVGLARQLQDQMTAAVDTALGGAVSGRVRGG